MKLDLVHDGQELAKLADHQKQRGLRGEYGRPVSCDKVMFLGSKPRSIDDNPHQAINLAGKHNLVGFLPISALTDQVMCTRVLECDAT